MTNISINNRYYNRFIQLERPVFPMKHNGTALCLQSRPHLGLRMHVFGCYTHEALVTQSATWVRSSLLDSLMLLLFRQPITSPIIVFTSSPTCLLVQTQLQSIDDQERHIIFSASATSPWPPAVLPFLLHCRWLRNEFRIRHAPENMSYQKHHYNFSTFGRNTILSLKYLGPVTVFLSNINLREAARTSSPNITHSAWMHDTLWNAIFTSLIG